jgi:acyl-CoA thioesterase II
MPELWNDLLHCLKLESGDQPQQFRARNQQLDYHRVFGGQLLGQAIEAARAVCPDKSVKSLHTVFPREGRADEPVHIDVTTHHSGRSFTTLAVTARQSRGVLAAASVSMHVVEDGPDIQDAAPVPALLGPEHTVELGLIPWETRSQVDLSDTATGPAQFEMWMRTPPADPGLAPALAAYATDLTLIGTAVRPMDGLSQRGNGTQFTSAVTSHTMWFHRPFRTDEWLLLRQHSPLLAHGRCFGRGDLLTTDGAVVASYAQEALLRIAG